MANPFDQFDAPTPVAPVAQAANPFDKFDPPTGFLANAADTVAGGLRGLQRGLVGAAGIPGNIANLAGAGMDALVGGSAAALGVKPLPPEAAAHARALTHIPDSNDLNNAADAVTAATGGGQPYAPKGIGGQAAQTVGEMVPAAVATGGASVPNILRQAVAPGLASEAAGQATQGTAAEPYARLVGALLGGGAAGLTALPSQVDFALARAGNNVLPEAWPVIRDRLAEGQQAGFNPTLSEVIDHTTNGRAAGRVMRLAEMLPRGQDVTDAFMQNRAGLNDRAVGNVFDQIAPGGALPSVLGLRAQKAGEGAVQGVQDDINASTASLYAAAEPQVLSQPNPLTLSGPIESPPAALSAPAFQATLAKMRADPVLGPQFAHLPDSSIAVIDAVTKQMEAEGQAAKNLANPGYAPYKGSIQTGAAAGARDVATQASPEYAQALAEQARARQEILDPIKNSAVGKAADSAGNVAATNSALYPHNPQAGLPQETVASLKLLDEQDPGIAAALTRQFLETKYATYAKDSMGGPNAQGGARFRANTEGNPIARENVGQGVEAAAPQAKQAFDQMMWNLAAQGRRQNPGSITAPATWELGNLAQPGIAEGIALNGMTEPLRGLSSVKDYLDRLRVSGRAAEIAKTMLGENADASIARIRQAQDAMPTLGGVFAKALGQGGSSQNQQ